MPQGTAQGGQGGVQTETDRQDLEHMPLVVFLGGVLCGFWAKAGLVNSSLKSQVLVRGA